MAPHIASTRECFFATHVVNILLDEMDKRANGYRRRWGPWKQPESEQCIQDNPQYSDCIRGSDKREPTPYKLNGGCQTTAPQDSEYLTSTVLSTHLPSLPLQPPRITMTVTKRVVRVALLLCDNPVSFPTHLYKANIQASPGR